MRKPKDWGQPCPNSDCSHYRLINRGNMSAISTYMTQSGKRRIFRCSPRSRSQVELPDFCLGETRCYGMKPYCAMMRLSQVTTGGASWPLLCSRFVP
jgi:hypothetical protein